MTTSRFPLRSTAFCLLLLLAPALTPLAAAREAPEETRYDVKYGGAYAWSTAPLTHVDGWVRLTGAGTIAYDLQVGTNGAGADYARFAADLSGGGWCRFEILFNRAVPVYDNYLSCGQIGGFHTIPNAQPGTYQIRISCDARCLVDVYRLEASSTWDKISMLYLGSYAATDVSEGRYQVPPGTCAKFAFYTSYSHSTLLEIDWGDGTPIDARPMPRLYSESSVCHQYPPAAVPYQACFRFRETNGVQRITARYCHDLWFMLPTV